VGRQAYLGPADARSGSEHSQKDRQPPESAQTAEEDDSARTGIFTSGIVSTRAGNKIALFFTGRKHAGENLADVLGQRAQELPVPIQIPPPAR
jgi:glycine cleavage system aminomethyltransferase T